MTTPSLPENGDMPERMQLRLAEVRRTVKKCAIMRMEPDITDATLVWLADRLEQAERDTKRLDYLADWFSDGNDVCLSHDVPDGDQHQRTWRVANMDILNVEDYEAGSHEKESLRDAIDAAIAAPLPTPKQGDTIAATATGDPR